MKVQQHVIISGVLGSVIYIITKSVPSAIGALFAGVLIDADHFIDYYLNHGFTVNIKKIYAAIDGLKLKRIYLFLHSYELVIALWMLGFFIPSSDLYFAISLSFTLHIFLDHIHNPVTPMGYFLFHRIRNKFDRKAFLTV